MTAEEWTQKYSGLPALIGEKKVVFLAATGTMAEVASRVFERGELTNGGRISYKENYEVYVYSPPFPRKPGAQLGKPNKDGERRKIKGGWFPTYLAAKADQGRAQLPFELTGQLRKSYLGGPRPRPTEIGPYEVVIDLDREAANKWEGLTETKGEFLRLTTTEVDSYFRRVGDIYTELLQ